MAIERIAHRGARRELPENTIAAFERAFGRGAVAIELDVHATRDSVVVVHHDPDLALPVSGGAQVEQELERRGVPLTQPLVEPGRRRAPLVEHVAGDDLEEVTALEPLLGLVHDRRVPAGDRLRR